MVDGGLGVGAELSNTPSSLKREELAERRKARGSANNCDYGIGRDYCMSILVVSME